MFVILTRRRILSAVAVVAALMVGVAGLWLTSSPAAPLAVAAEANWGLRFHEAGQPPVGNATPEELAQYNAYYRGDPAQRRLYLTFDAGYENGYTPAILDTLREHQVPAAFFVVGHYIDSAPALVQRMVAEGHTVANHTHSHPNMTAIAHKDAFLQELRQVEEAFHTLTGKTMPPYYRPPQGKYSIDNLTMAKEAGYHTFFWSLAYVDWETDRQPSREQALEKLVGRIHPGAVVLLHSTSATNAQVLGEVITQWKELGYTFGTLAELCAPQRAY